jgi:hypothetical protein
VPEPYAWVGMWIVLTAQVEGNDEDGFRVVWYSDWRTFTCKSGAVSHGFELARSDDFCTGLVKHGTLAELWWMDKRKDDEDLAAIGAEIGLSCPDNATRRECDGLWMPGASPVQLAFPVRPGGYRPQSRPHGPES